MITHEYDCVPADQHQEDLARMEQMVLEVQVQVINAQNAQDVQRAQAVRAERMLQDAHERIAHLEHYVALRAMHDWEKKHRD